MGGKRDGRMLEGRRGQGNREGRKGIGMGEERRGREKEGSGWGGEGKR